MQELEFVLTVNIFLSSKKKTPVKEKLVISLTGVFLGQIVKAKAMFSFSK